MLANRKHGLWENALNAVPCLREMICPQDIPAARVVCTAWNTELSTEEAELKVMTARWPYFVEKMGKEQLYRAPSPVPKSFKDVHKKLVAFLKDFEAPAYERSSRRVTPSFTTHGWSYYNNGCAHQSENAVIDDFKSRGYRPVRDGQRIMFYVGDEQLLLTTANDLEGARKEFVYLFEKHAAQK